MYLVLIDVTDIKEKVLLREPGRYWFTEETLKQAESTVLSLIGEGVPVERIKVYDDLRKLDVNVEVKVG